MRHMLRVFNDIYLLTGHPFCETPTGQVELLHCFGLEGNLKKSRAVEEKKARDEKLFSLVSLYTWPLGEEIQEIEH